MDVTLTAHVMGGVLGILFGFTALYTAKGGSVHRRSGLLFVYAMLTMSLLGATLAIVRHNAPQSNASVGLLTAYFVMTALTTVRPPSVGVRRVDIGLMLVALAIGAALFTFGAEAKMTPKGTLNGMPAVGYFVFGSIALMAGAGDIRMLRSAALRGAPRLTRHLWRMCAALFIAAASFFLGPTRRIPEIMRIPWLLPVPVLAILVTMLYWLWRVRSKRTIRGLVEAGAPGGDGQVAIRLRPAPLAR